MRLGKMNSNKDVKKDNNIGKNVSYNVIKQCCTILFPLISFTYSSHVLGADRIGIWSFSHSIISYFGLIVGLGFTTYAIREGAYIRDDKIMLNKFVNQIFTLNIISLIVGYIVLAIIIMAWNKLESYCLCIEIQSIGVLLSTIGIDWLNSIFEDYKYITIRYLLIQIISIILLILFVRNENDLIAYTCITVLATYGGNLCNLFYIRKRYFTYKLTTELNCKKHLPPIMILFCSAAAVTIYTMSDTTMLGVYYDDTTVGIYSIAVKVYSLIKQLINAVVIVTVPRFSYLLVHKDKHTYNKLANKIFQAVILLILPLIAGILCEGENILYLFAGKEYVLGKGSLDILCFSLFFAVGGSFFANSILITNKKEKIFLFATIIAAVINIGLNFYMIPNYGMNGAAITTLIAEAINFILCAYKSIRLVRFNIKINSIISYIVGSFFVGMICIYVNTLALTRSIKIISATLISVIVYFLILILIKDKLVLYCINKIKNIFNLFR